MAAGYRKLIATQLAALQDVLASEYERTLSGIERRVVALSEENKRLRDQRGGYPTTPSGKTKRPNKRCARSDEAAGTVPFNVMRSIALDAAPDTKTENGTTLSEEKLKTHVQPPADKGSADKRQAASANVEPDSPGPRGKPAPVCETTAVESIAPASLEATSTPRSTREPPSPPSEGKWMTVCPAPPPGPPPVARNANGEFAVVPTGNFTPLPEAPAVRTLAPPTWGQQQFGHERSDASSVGSVSATGAALGAAAAALGTAAAVLSAAASRAPQSRPQSRAPSEMGGFKLPSIDKFSSVDAELNRHGDGADGELLSLSAAP